MIFEKLDDLCAKNGTNITTLCKEITGSTGNLPTWKKDRIRPDWLRSICLKFNISSDYLLDLPSKGSSESNLQQEERDALIRYKRLNSDYRIKAQAYMIDLYEKQEHTKSLSDWLYEDDDNRESVAADETRNDDQPKK